MASERRLRRGRDLLRALWSRLWAGLGIGLVVVAVLFAAVAVNDACCDNPPLQIQTLDRSSAPRVVCPGDEYPVHSQITVTAKTALYIYISVMDETESYNIGGTQRNFEPRPHPHAASFVQTLPWTVPELMPGRYVRMTWIRGHDTDQDPAFSGVPIVVPPDC